MARTKVEMTDLLHLVDEDDLGCVVQVYTTFVEHRPVSGNATWLPGSKELRMPDGGHVNRVADGTFVELATGRVMRPR